MVAAAQRRAAVHHLTDRRYSQRRACRLVGLPRSVAWYRLKGRDEADLRHRLKVLAERWPNALQPCPATPIGGQNAALGVRQESSLI